MIVQEKLVGGKWSPADHKNQFHPINVSLLPGLLPEVAALKSLPQRSASISARWSLDSPSRRHGFGNSHVRAKGACATLYNPRTPRGQTNCKVYYARDNLV